ncbi:MAG: universal stress protein [Pseudomonadota bacterium]
MSAEHPVAGPDLPPLRGQAGARFRILVCIDNSEESNRALRYAVRIGSGTDADLTLLFVRPADQGLETGGMEIAVARENMLSWGLELPGKNALNQARDTLIELGFLSPEWEAQSRHVDVQGDPLGDYSMEYEGGDGRTICLKLAVAPTHARGILEECERSEPDLVIVAMSEEREGAAGKITRQTAETVAREHTGTVLVARELEESHGHLVCVWDNPESIQAARRDAEIAGRCMCPIHLFAVAPSEEERSSAETAIANAEAAIKEAGIPIFGKKVMVGEPAEAIIEEGRGYSVIVMSSRSKTGLRRLLSASTSLAVLQNASNSVMIAR